MTTQVSEQGVLRAFNGGPVEVTPGFELSVEQKRALRRFAVDSGARAASLTDTELVLHWQEHMRSASGRVPETFAQVIERAEPNGAAVGQVDSAALSKALLPLIQALIPPAPALDVNVLRAEMSAQMDSAIEAALAKRVQEPRRIEVVRPDKTSIVIETAHPSFRKVLALSVAGPVMLVGPAGSGKTMLAEQLAHALGRRFSYNGAISQEYKLLGSHTATGGVIRTPFRETYEFGGVHLFDEIDGSLPSAVLPFNAALANGHCDFPDAIVPRHPDFLAIAAANTWGNGADREYVGRYQQDGAAMDRFSMVYLDYDEAFERKLAGNDEWVARVQSIRHAIRRLKLRHIVSMRASIKGAVLLAGGELTQAEIEDAVIWKGMAPDVRARVEGAI